MSRTLGKRITGILAGGHLDMKVKQAIELAVEGGMEDSGHHKQWYFDQILQALMGEEEYTEWREEDEAGRDWEVGIPP